MTSNRLEKLAPNIFINLKKLRELDISNNNLEVLSEWGLHALKNLELLKLDNNKFKSFDNIQLNTVNLTRIWISLSYLSNKDDICKIKNIIKPTVNKVSVNGRVYYNTIYITADDYRHCMFTWYFLKHNIRYNTFEDYKFDECVDELLYEPINNFKEFCLLSI